MSKKSSINVMDYKHRDLSCAVEHLFSATCSIEEMQDLFNNENVAFSSGEKALLSEKVNELIHSAQNLLQNFSS